MLEFITYPINLFNNYLLSSAMCSCKGTDMENRGIAVSNQVWDLPVRYSPKVEHVCQEWLELNTKKSKLGTLVCVKQRTWFIRIEEKAGSMTAGTSRLHNCWGWHLEDLVCKVGCRLGRRMVVTGIRESSSWWQWQDVEDDREWDYW